MKEEVIILGGGWSVKEGIEKGLWDNIKGKEIWSLNFAFMTMPYLPTRQLWIDFKFFKNYTKEVYELQRKGVMLCTREDDRYNIFREIKQYKIDREYKEDSIFTGRNGLVGFFALSIAVKEKYKRIFLLGYDFGGKPDNINFTHYYQGKLSVFSDGIGDPYIYMEKDGKAVKALKDFDYYSFYKEHIYNVSMLSKIYQFNKITYDSFFQLIRKEGGK